MSGTDSHSRYRGLAPLEIINQDGKSVRYYPVRPVRPTLTNAGVRLEKVNVGDRPDLVSYRAYGTPLKFHVIADQNVSPNPFELTTAPGRLLQIPLALP